MIDGRLQMLFHERSAAFAEILRCSSRQLSGNSTISDAVSVYFSQETDLSMAKAGDVVPFILRVQHSGYMASTSFGIVFRGRDVGIGVEPGRICNIDDYSKEVPPLGMSDSGLMSQVQVLGRAICLA